MHLSLLEHFRFASAQILQIEKLDFIVMFAFKIVQEMQYIVDISANIFNLFITILDKYLRYDIN